MLLLLAGLAYLFLPQLPGSLAADSGMFAAIRDGFGFIVRSRWIAGSALVTFVYMICFAGGLQVLTLAVADGSFGRVGMGIAASCQIAGGILGVLMILAIRDRVRLSSALAAMGCSLSLPLLVLASGAAGYITNRPPATTFLLVTSIAMFIAGAIGQGAATIQALALQRNVSPGAIGRASSYIALASVGGIPIGEIIAAPLERYVGVAASLVILACATVAVSSIVASLPAVRRIYSGTGELRRVRCGPRT